MVSKARLLFPEPESPVSTTSSPRRISTLTSFRLCSRAPRTRMKRVCSYMCFAKNHPRRPRAKPLDLVTGVGDTARTNHELTQGDRHMTRVVAFFQPGWADWEAGSVLALLREHFGAAIMVATPDGGPQTSIGGVRAAADAAFADIRPADAEVFLAIGSGAWPDFHDEAFSDLLRQALHADKIVGAICAATIAAARAGLFEGRLHTSNGKGWLLDH